MTVADLKSFYINLDNAVERRAHMSAQISNISFEIERFSAILGSVVKEKIPGMSNGQLGCLLSHLTLLEDRQNNNFNLLILEDDVVLSQDIDLLPSLPGYMSNNLPDWDVVYIDATIVQPSLMSYFFSLKKQLPPKQISVVKVERNMQAFGTHGYLVNKNSTAKLAGLIRAYMSQGKAIDNIYVALTEAERINSYICLPYLCCGSIHTLNSQIEAGDVGDNIKIWHQIRRMYAKRNPISSEDERQFADLIQQHLSLYGNTTFGHFLRI